MKKLLWFLCIYNLIFIFTSFPVFASVKGGYNPGPNGIGVKMKDVKPFEVKELTLYENEWACIFSNANIGNYSTSDNRYIKIIGEYEPHSIIEPHDGASKECKNTSDNHSCNSPTITRTYTFSSNHGIAGPFTASGGGCSMKAPCGGKACNKLNSFKYPNPMMAIEVETRGPIFVISDSLNVSSGTLNFNYTSSHGLVGGAMTEERTFHYAVANIADIKNDYLDGASGNTDVTIDSEDDSSGDYDTDDDDYDPDDYEDYTDPDTGHTTTTYKWAELEELAGQAGASYKSNGTISYSSAFDMNNTYPLSGTSDKWFTDGVNWYYKYSEGDNPKKKWVNQGGKYWFITSSSRTSIELQLPPTEADPSTGDPGGEERTKEISVWEVTFAQGEYLLISDGSGPYYLYEFDDEGYLTPETTNGYQHVKFNKSGKVVKS